MQYENNINRPVEDTINTAKAHAKASMQSNIERSLGLKVRDLLGEVIMRGNFEFLQNIFDMIAHMFAHGTCLLFHKKIGERFLSITLTIIFYYLISFVGWFTGFTRSILGFGSEMYLYHFYAQLVLLFAIGHYARILLKRHFNVGSAEHVYSHSFGVSWFYEPYMELASKTRLPELSPVAFVKYVESLGLMIIGFTLKYFTGVGFFTFLALSGASVFYLVSKREKAFREHVLDAKDAQIINDEMAAVMHQNQQNTPHRSKHGFSISRATVNDIRETFGPIQDEYSDELEALKHKQQQEDESSQSDG